MIEFFFDCSSPWTYLGFHNVQPLAAEFGQKIRWRPFLAGGVFNSINPSVYASREHPVPAKQRYTQKDLADWARVAGVTIHFPPSVFPVNSVKAMRGCVLLAETEHLVPFATAVFEAYWRDDRDISRDDVLADVCRSVRLDPADFAAGIARQDVKDELRANTDELVARGGFGTPTVFLDGDDMYFGNDRLPLLRAALQARLNRDGSATA